MKKILSVEKMRISDAYEISCGTPQSLLIERAGRALYDSCVWKPPVAVLCGKGNNGADGYALADILEKNNIEHKVFNVFDPDRFNEIKDLTSFNTIADCIFGTGFRNGLDNTVSGIIDSVNSSGAFVVSADINSGLNGRNGLAEKCVVSDLTVSFGEFQPGHFLGMSADVMRSKINVDIGIRESVSPWYLYEPSDAASLLKPRKRHSNKGTYGYIALIGGSSRYCGAPRLAATAASAMRSGAGVVRLAVPRELCGALYPVLTDCTLFPLNSRNADMVFSEEEFSGLLKGIKAVSFGMGMGDSEETSKALRFVLNNYKGILIIDADGLNALAREDTHILDETECSVVLTPHPGEFSRLTGKTVAEILEAPAEAAVEYAAKHNVTVVLKLSSTIITDGRKVYFTDRGCPGMATAGSGDVLSGIMAALFGWSEEGITETASAAAVINGLAGELAQRQSCDISMTASDTASYVRDAVTMLREGGLT